MKELLNRLKSPVVIAQLLSIIGTLIVVLLPQFSDEVKKVVVGLTTILNIFSGVNNPTDKISF